VKYLLITEAPPWSTEGDITYFYHGFDAPLKQVWKTFFCSPPPKEPIQAFNKLAETQFLLIDSLTLPVKYESRDRKKALYSDYVRKCDYLVSKINHPDIKRSNGDVRIAFAFKLNGKAIIRAFPDGIRLPTDQRKKLTEELIAADRSHYPNPERLKRIYGL